MAAYRPGPEGNASAITNMITKAKAFVKGLVPATRSFSPSFA